jgi:translation initiation factor 2 beta subunit (eIF-2beta)/eIF-5
MSVLEVDDFYYVCSICEEVDDTTQVRLSGV